MFLVFLLFFQLFFSELLEESLDLSESSLLSSESEEETFFLSLTFFGFTDDLSESSELESSDEEAGFFAGTFLG